MELCFSFFGDCREEKGWGIERERETHTHTHKQRELGRLWCDEAGDRDGWKAIKQKRKRWAGNEAKMESMGQR